MGLPTPGSVIMPKAAADREPIARPRLPRFGMVEVHEELLGRHHDCTKKLRGDEQVLIEVATASCVSSPTEVCTGEINERFPPSAVFLNLRSARLSP
jgi:hypothetical protein